MTIFPCCRCGIVPEVTVAPDERTRRPMAVIRHECENGRRYYARFTDADRAAAADGCVYRWNEQNAADNPKWWPERYDYLRTLCRTREAIL